MATVVKHLIVEEPVKHLTTEELAERLGGDFSPRSLERWRREGRGPKFIRLGPRGFVRYRVKDVEDWEQSLLVDA